MRLEDDELIAHMRERLTEHEEAYLPGAWERFEKKERKGRGLLWLASLASAAAVFLIGFALFYTSNDHKIKQTGPYTHVSNKLNDTIGAVQSAPPVPNEKPVGRTITENLNTPVARNEAVTLQRKNNNISSSPLITSLPQPDVTEKQANMTVKQQAVETKVPPVQTTADSGLVAKTPVKTEEPRSFQDFLNEEVKANPAMAQTKAAAKSDKWEMGVMVAPSVGNGKKLNMGYGLSMAYALSDKVSISSGIAYSQMGASKDLAAREGTALNSPAGLSAMVQETKSLQSVDASLVGLDIPIEIRYYFSKKLYTNVGLSAFAVLSQKQNNNYLQGTLETAAFSSNTGQSGFNSVYRQESISEPFSEAEIRNDKYLGFYNISFGYRQKIAGKSAFAVEPFLKLPVKEFTKENLYLLGTGIRLKFDF